MGDRHDKTAEAIRQFVFRATGNSGMPCSEQQLAADLRRIAEEEEKLRDINDGCCSVGGLAVELGMYKKLASEGETVYRTVEEVIQALGKTSLWLTVEDRVVFREFLSRYRPPCTCNVDAAVREAVEAEREACIRDILDVDCKAPSWGLHTCRSTWRMVEAIRARGASR